MNKFLRFLTVSCLLALLLTFTAFAQESEIPTPVSVTGNFNNVYKFVEKGALPDLSAATVTAVYEDETEQTVTLDSTYLPEDTDTSETGLLKVPLTVFDTEFKLQFTVIDSNADLSRFTDFGEDYWGYKKIRHVVMAGFFKGVSDTEFGVKDSMTRAQFCQMIYNIYKDDSDIITRANEAAFIDVQPGSWFFDAVSACAESGIVNGIGDGLFNPNAPISREDTAIIMMRILIGADGIENTDEQSALAAARKSGIAAGDFDSTRGYAKKAVAAALGVIYFGDTDGNINPRANITRAETAAMISNMFFKGYIEPEKPEPEPEPEPKKLIYISPENRSNEYTGVNTTEHEQMVIIANKMKTILEQNGFEVFIADKKTSIRENEGEMSRAEQAKQMGADAYIALHSNSMPGNNGKYQGCICFYNGNNEGAKDLSQKIYDNLEALTPTKDGGSRNDMIENKPFVEVRLPEMANVLIEVEYHDYKPYAQWIVNNTDSIAKAIADGIIKHFA